MSFDAVADFTLGTPMIPEHVLERAALLLVDTLGVAAGATPMEAARIARTHARQFFNTSERRHRAHLLFDGRTASIPGAAFAAATQIDNLDAHDGYNPTKGHIGCAAVPALCAFAEAAPDLTGRQALEALVIAYEIAARAAVSLHNTVTDYHTSGAWNGLGVVAIGARLRGLSQAQLREALGVAEYHGPRSQMMREIANPTMLHDGSGMGALVGAMAVLLAEDGFKGAPAITVEGPGIAEIWEDLGQRWTILENYIKPYPICRWAHAAIDAVSGVLTENALTDADVRQIDVRTFAEAAALYREMPETTSQAQYSLAYALAARIVYGAIGPREIMGSRLNDARVARALSKIAIEETARHSRRFPGERWSDVTVHTLDGRALASGDIHARGGPEAPMDLSEVEAKFHLMAAPLASGRRSAIWDMTTSLTAAETPFTNAIDLITAPPERS